MMDSELSKADLVHCIYSSATTIELTDKDIASILKSARETNAKIGVTGILLYDSGSFFQVLEGKPKTVTAIYNKILKDKRHTRVTKIIYEPIDTRGFSEWTMGYAGISRAELNEIEGLNDFFLQGRCYTDLDEGRAKTLLDAFKDGSWRMAIK